VFPLIPLQQKKCGSLTRPQALQRTITGTGLRAFGPFLIPLLWGETFLLGTAMSSIEPPLKEKLGKLNPMPLFPVVGFRSNLGRTKSSGGGWATMGVYLLEPSAHPIFLPALLNIAVLHAIDTRGETSRVVML